MHKFEQFIELIKANRFFEYNLYNSRNHFKIDFCNKHECFFQEKR